MSCTMNSAKHVQGATRKQRGRLPWLVGADQLLYGFILYVIYSKSIFLLQDKIPRSIKTPPHHLGLHFPSQAEDHPLLQKRKLRHAAK